MNLPVDLIGYYIFQKKIKPGSSEDLYLIRVILIYTFANYNTELTQGEIVKPSLTFQPPEECIERFA